MTNSFPVFISILQKESTNSLLIPRGNADVSFASESCHFAGAAQTPVHIPSSGSNENLLPTAPLILRVLLPVEILEFE